MRITIAASAYNDFESIQEYYKDEGVPEIGQEFIRSIFFHIETLLENPDIGRIVPEFDDSKIRELIHSPF